MILNDFCGKYVKGKTYVGHMDILIFKVYSTVMHITKTAIELAENKNMYQSYMYGYNNEI